MVVSDEGRSNNHHSDVGRANGGLGSAKNSTTPRRQSGFPSVSPSPPADRGQAAQRNTAADWPSPTTFASSTMAPWLYRTPLQPNPVRPSEGRSVSLLKSFADYARSAKDSVGLVVAHSAGGVNDDDSFAEPARVHRYQDSAQRENRDDHQSYRRPQQEALRIL